ncbi:MAG: NAD-dependent epimerase/dehydratase family protein, partial [Bradymonadaceae bacterium]
MSEGTILITGAAGFIGSHLCQRCLADGHRVIGVDNLLTGRPDNLQPYADHDRFEFRKHDVAEPLTVDGPVDWVYHLASPASPPKYQRHSLACMRANSEGTWRLLELARRRRAGFVLASTSEVYGDPQHHPQPETYAGHVHTIGPRAVYDEAKRFSETLVFEFGESHDLPVRIARIFNTYGPRMSPDDGRVVSNFACQAL